MRFDIKILNKQEKIEELTSTAISMTNVERLIKVEREYNYYMSKRI